MMRMEWAGFSTSEKDAAMQKKKFQRPKSRRERENPKIVKSKGIRAPKWPKTIEVKDQ